MNEALKRGLLPDTCYRHCSGGDPLAIPELVYDDLVAFHRSRYNPANACFATYGALEPAELHARFAPYLDSIEAIPLEPAAVQSPITSASTEQVPVPIDEDADPRDVSAAMLAWAWPESAPLDESLLCDLAEELLLGHPGAPLRLALDRSGLGRSTGGSGYAG